MRAVGDGVVEYAGAKGGYGNVVILRHHGQYTTVYAHLSRIACASGARVAQNDTIGAVGQTGWATGPHLHYEFRIAGQARNPFSIAMPAALPVAQQDLPGVPQPRRDAGRAPRPAQQRSRSRRLRVEKQRGPKAPFSWLKLTRLGRRTKTRSRRCFARSGS